MQPHAPNTVDARVYGWAAGLAGSLGLPLCTHSAETPEERRFVAEGAGPQREMLEIEQIVRHRRVERHPRIVARQHRGRRGDPLPVRLGAKGQRGEDGERQGG